MAYSSRRPVSRDQITQRRHKPDYWLLVLSTILLTIGLVVIYSISPGLSAGNHVGDSYFVNRQLIATGLGIVSFVALANLPLAIWKRAERPLIIAAGISAVAVRFFGQRVNGAYRWIQIGGMSFQAAELIKFALLIWLAGFMTAKIREGALTNIQTNFQQIIKPLLIVLGLIGVVVAGLQSDLGSTGVMVAIMAAMVFVAGLPLKRVVMIAAIVLAGTVLAVSTSSYRRDRLLTFLHPERDCLNTGYQACQALDAIGSGGMIGAGLGHSVFAYGYLPESANDSIFAIYAEKFGFIGTTILVGIYVALFSRLKRIIEHTNDTYNRLIVTGILAWISTQAIINIGAMVGLLPLKGITLPLISYGGTSLLFITGGLGLAFQISRYTSHAVVTEKTYERQGAYSGSGYRDLKNGSR